MLRFLAVSCDGERRCSLESKQAWHVHSIASLLTAGWTVVSLVTW